MTQPSFRSQFVTKRTYNRPLDEEGTLFETRKQTIDRVISHQKWLWETAKGKLIGEDIDVLNENELNELEELRQLMLNYEASVSGRTLWLGGTDISKKFHATQFNCSFIQIRTVHDLVDAFHNLLLGVGVGFEPITGILNGFVKPVEVEIIRSTRHNRGDDNNKERHYRRGDKRVWHLVVGDSGIAWAKAAGKLIAMKKPVDIVVIDFSEVRPGGKPLRGFGWISSGDEQISKSFYEISQILNKRAGELLTRIDIMDIMNWLGTSLSSRRSAEIALMPADDPEAEDFAIAKKDYWKTGNIQRAQSNNSLIFYHKPTKRELRGLFSQMLDAGGCLPNWALLLTPNGVKELSDIKPGDTIWSKDGWCTVKNKWSTGIKDVFGYKTTSGTLFATENHQVVIDANNNKASVGSSKVLTRLTGPLQDNIVWDTNAVVCGLLIGDGTKHHGRDKECMLYIGKDDQDYFNSEIAEFIGVVGCPRDGGYIMKTTLDPKWLVNKSNIIIPRYIMNSSWHYIASFLRGLFSANGHISLSQNSTMVKLSCTSATLRDQVILLLSSLGIRSRYITKKATQHNIITRLNKIKKFKAKESYEVRITNDVEKYASMIGFLQKYKNDNLQKLLYNKLRSGENNTKNLFDIKDHYFVSREEVFDIEVDNISHTFWCNGFDISNSEPGFINGDAARKRAPYFRGCNPSLRKGTRVLTSTGIYPIEDLEDNDISVPNLYGEYSSATCFLSGLNKPLYKIELEGGYTYYATAEHKWPVYERYEKANNQITGRIVKKETAELNTKDYIPYNRTSKLFDGIGGTRDEGFFIGWLLGDGWVTIRSDTGKQQIGLIIGENDDSILPELTRILQNIGCNATFRSSSNGAKSIELNTQNSNIDALLKSCGWNGKERLPDLVWTGSEDFRKGIIDGLISSDGYIDSTKGGRIGFGSKHKSLVQDVQDLFGFYGIPMSCEYKITNATFPNGNSGKYEYYASRSLGGTASAIHFSSVFNLTNSRKNEKLIGIKSKRVVLPKLRVKNVELTDLQEDVWDLTVYDDTHSFRLPAVVTGNCAEILLGEKSYCNLVVVNLGKFNGRPKELQRAFWIISRANYRQTCVDFRDGILQETWHELNQFLRLTGVGCAGIVLWEHHKNPKELRKLRNYAHEAVDSMAKELNLPKSKTVTTVKPDGTLGKTMDTTEGIHKPLSKYIINNIIISKASPVCKVAIDAGYRHFEHPFDSTSEIISLPICFEGIEFDEVEVDGKILEVNLESAIDQLNRYKMWMDNYADHNVSITVSYSPNEVENIVEWLHSNWDHFVGVSFLLRTDPTKTAEDLGYKYLPQQPITKEEYYEYVAQLKEVDLDTVFVNSLEDLDEQCSTGMCPIR